MLWHRIVPANTDSAAWVISGHRGRHCLDNAKYLFEYISRSTSQPIVWIGNGSMPGGLRRGSFAARLAIARAPVLIYSHGEDDLDPCLVACRSLVAMRIYIGHGANLVKRGSMHPDNMQRIFWPLRLCRQLAATDYDLLLCQSDLEMQCWNANQPGKREKHVVCGGPRLDQLLGTPSNSPQKRILWFPTFRDTSAGRRRLLHTLQLIVSNPRLANWLRETGYRLEIGLHINQSPNLQLPTPTREISFVSAVEMPQQMIDAELLITDYSSVLIDWLILDRPAMFFPFDMQDYLQGRGLHFPYEEYAYGPVVLSAEAFVSALTDGAWRDNLHRQQRREQLRRKFLHGLSDGNSASCYNAIVQALAQHDATQKEAASS